jgi:threonine dehydratase
MNFAVIRDRVDDVVLVTDEEMLEAARRLWFEAGVAAELSGAAALAAIVSGRIPLAGVRAACVVVCGAGTDGMSG